MSRKSNKSTKASRLGWYALEWRDRAGKNQEDLGAELRVNASQISHYERLSRQPNVEKIAKLARALGIEPWQLFTDPSVPSVLVTGEEARLIMQMRRMSKDDLAAFEILLDRFLKPYKGGGNA